MASGGRWTDSYAAPEVEQEVSNGFYKARATLANGPWTFDADVANCFPDMLRRSIPGYETGRPT